MLKKRNASHSHVFATPFLLLFPYSMLGMLQMNFRLQKNNTAITNQLEYTGVYVVDIC